MKIVGVAGGEGIGLGMVECIRMGQRARIVIQNASFHNSLDRAMWEQLEEHALGLAEDDHLKVIVVEGAGRQFSIGYDLRELVSLDLIQAQAGLNQMERALVAMEAIEVPVVCALRGFALGGGLALALTADLRVADDTVRLGMPVTGLGIAISETFAGRLLSAFGEAKTRELLFLGEFMRGSDAVVLGAVHRIVGRRELDRVVEEWQSLITGMSSEALRKTKRALTRTTRKLSPGAPELVGKMALEARFFGA